MSHFQHIRLEFAHAIQPVPESHSDTADRQKRFAPLFHMTGILVLLSVDSAAGSVLGALE